MNNNLDGFNGLYGPGPNAVLAEMGRRKNKARQSRGSAGDEAQAAQWKHKQLFFASGVLLVAALVIIGGSGV